MPETAIQVERCYLERVPLAEADNTTLAEWEAFRARQSPDVPLLDPVWLRGYFAGSLQNLYAYLLRESGSLCGVAPFLLKDWPLKWQLGEVTVAQPRLSRLRLLGGSLNLPETESSYDLLFGELATSATRFDAIQLEEVPLDSFLWKYLQGSKFIRSAFRLYVPDIPTPHLEIRLVGTYDQYLKKFSTKSRNSLRRKVKRIRDGVLGPMRLAQYTKPEEVSGFLESATEVSKKTYQWNLLQKGLSQTDLLKRRMVFAAEHGWLRSYILFCNEAPCAFFVGFQHDKRFLLSETGFDPELAKYSVGTVLHLLIIEDLFAHDTPKVFDLSSYGSWKAALSTDSYMENKAMLFRPGAYGRFVQVGHWACQAISRGGAIALERVQLKKRLKRMIRALSTLHNATHDTTEATADEFLSDGAPDRGDGRQAF